MDHISREVAYFANRLKELDEGKRATFLCTYAIHTMRVQSNSVTLDITIHIAHRTPLGSFCGSVNQQYLSDKVGGTEFYKPVLEGEEVKLADIYERIKEFRKKK